MAKIRPKRERSSKDGLAPPAFAEKVGVSRERIHQAIKAGILSKSVKKVPYGKSFRFLIDEELGLQEWKDNIDPAKKRDPEKIREGQAMNGGAAPSGYQKAKAMKEFFAAKLAELEYQHRAGKYVPAAQVKTESFRIGRRLRDSILGVPERIAAELAAMNEPRVITIYLKEQLAAALKDLGDLDAVGNPKK